MHAASSRTIARLWLTGALIGFGCCCSVHAGTFERTLTRDDVDLQASQSFQDDVPKAVEPEVLFEVLGLHTGPAQRSWAAGYLDSFRSVTFRYLIVFKRPIDAGSIIVDSPGHRLGYAKADAPLPPNPKDESAWIFPPRVGKAGTALYALPPGTRTSAILVIDRREISWSKIAALAILKTRWQNITPAALAYASHEYTPPKSPNTCFASYIVDGGGGHWASSGVDEKGLVSTPAVSDINPEWFMLTWKAPQTIGGLWLGSNAVTWSLDYYTGPESLNPRVGLPAEWRRVPKFTVQEARGRWILFDQPLRTRGLRLNILKTEYQSPRVATIHGLHVLREIQDPPSSQALSEQAQAQNTKPQAQNTKPQTQNAAGPLDSEQSPFSFPYRLATGENMTLVVNDAAGRRARNLVTREPSPSPSSPASASAAGTASAAGALQQAWDLKDEDGNYVPPGVYEWRAITWPTLQTKYEFTVYPNVSRHAPENPPWLTGHAGAGGWLADHTPPICVAAGGDRVYLGAVTAESGVSLIECDLAGKKLWGHHSFAAWTGPRYLAADGQTVFVGNRILDQKADNVWTVDVATKEVRPLLAIEPTAARNRGMQGLAVHAGTLAMSVKAQAHWLVNAAAAEDVDLDASYPRQRPERKERTGDEIVPKPQKDFLRLFRLMDSPPGMDHVDGSLVWLQSFKSTSPRQHIMLAFHRPVPLGSVAFPAPEGKDVRVELSVLKPAAPYPPNLDDPSQWIPFPEDADEPWDVVPAPAGTRTRALRITLVKGLAKDDLLAIGGVRDSTSAKLDISLNPDAKAKSAPGEFGADHKLWLGRLEGMKLLRRRFRNVMTDATIRVNSGKVTHDKQWDAQRTRPLSEADPGIYAIEWPAAHKVRGLAIKEIDGKTTKIDVYTGSDQGPIDIASDAGWETVGEHEPKRRNHHSGMYRDNHAVRYTDDYVDFGREISTRAIRLRVIEQWVDNGQYGEYGVRPDQGGLTIDPCRCRVYGVAPVEYVGDESAVDALDNQRIEFYDAATGKLRQEVLIDRPSQIAFHPTGELYALSGDQVVKVDRNGGRHQRFVSDLQSPVDLTFDAAGQLYVYDRGADRQNVRVYDSTGRYVRSIGKPGGYQAGAWDPQRFGQVTDIDIDRQGQLWVVENQYLPKRISLWSIDGTYKTEFLGNTPYGGGGVLDAVDKNRLFFGPLEFELDWKTGQSRLKNLTWHGDTPAGDVPIRIGGHTYLVTRPVFSQMLCGIVYRYEKDHLKMAAAMGPAIHFEPLKRPDMLARFGGAPLTGSKFIWSDRNDNGQVDFEEVVLSPKSPNMHGVGHFDHGLGLQSGTLRYEVKEFLPSGVPIYEERPQTQLSGGILYRLDNGNFYRMGDKSTVKEGVFAPDGHALWTYPQEGDGVLPELTFKPYSRGQVVSQFGICGHDTPSVGDLGEFVAMHANMGAWNIWTADGLLVGPLFRHLRDPLARPWSMPQHDRGMVLQDINPGQEHFAGHLCFSPQDKKFYAVAGHNHISVLEVLGMDQFKRTSGKFSVTPEDLRRTQAWTEQHEQQSVYQRAPVVDCYRLRRAPLIDGKLDDWEAVSAQIDPSAKFYIGYDDANLYLSYETYNLGPFKNTGEQWDRMFKSGACVDLQLATDPQTPENRTAPAAGDLRLLLSYLKDEPIAVLYRPIVPGTPVSRQWHVVSPVAEATFDSVTRLSGVRMFGLPTRSGYVVEASVPLASLGLKPAAGLRLKLDWGVLKTGPDGHEVMQRIYWANKATSVVADAPSEARLHPNLWGHVRFFDKNQTSAESRLDIVGGSPAAGKKKSTITSDVDDILGTLKQEKK